MKMKTSKKSLMELNYILYARETKETISYCWYIVLVATISFRFHLPMMLGPFRFLFLFSIFRASFKFFAFKFEQFSVGLAALVGVYFKIYGVKTFFFSIK